MNKESFPGYDESSTRYLYREDHDSPYPSGYNVGKPLPTASNMGNGTTSKINMTMVLLAHQLTKINHQYQVEDNLCSAGMMRDLVGEIMMNFITIGYFPQALDKRQGRSPYDCNVLWCT